MERPAHYLSAPGHDPEHIARVFQAQNKAALQAFLQDLIDDMRNPLPDGARRVGPRTLEILLSQV
jgi:hypothetical protein